MNPLARKLLIKPGSRIALVNAPAGYAERLQPLPDGAEVVGLQPGLDVVQVFAHDRTELERAAGAFGSVRDGGLLWVCYPKGGRKAGTDLNRDLLWEELGKVGLAGVTLVAVDDTWSAMRFRPAGDVGTLAGPPGHRPAAALASWRLDLRRHRHQRGRRLGNAGAVRDGLDGRAGVHQRSPHPLHPADHPHPLTDPQRAPQPDVEPARQPRAAGMPAGPAHGLVQHQSHYAAVHHALPALEAGRHLELADRSLLGRGEPHPQAVLVVLAAAEAAAVVGHNHAV
jgi:hypothetical protein